MHAMNQELFLVHFGHFTWLDVQSMSISEREWFYRQLVEVREQQIRAMGQQRS